MPGMGARIREPDIGAWLERSRLKVARGVRARADDGEMRQALKRFADSVRPAMGKLLQIVAQSRTG
jgi:hypothetical protein